MCYRNRRVRATITTCLFCLVLVCLLVQSSRADVIEAYENPAQFGNMIQFNVDNTWGRYGCGPTSTANTFLYLQNKYPSIFGTSLVPGDDLLTTAQTLGSSTYMDTKDTAATVHGTYIDYYVKGAHNYIEDRVPGETEYQVQVSSGHFTVPADVQVDWSWPTLNFLYSALHEGAGVGILINWTTSDGELDSHYLTLTGLSFDNSSGTGTLYYVDPLSGDSHYGDMYLQSDQVWFHYGNHYVGSNEAFIRMAMSMDPVGAPVPEPTTMLLLGSGLIGLLGYGRKRFRK